MKTIAKLLFCSLLAAVAGGALPCEAQTPAVASSAPMPTDPAALMQLAAQKNGLAGKGLKPWHIKVAYQTYDAKGNPSQQGTFEEWWNSPSEYVRHYEGQGLRQESQVNAKGKFIEGVVSLPYFASVIENIYLHPFPKDPAEDGLHLHHKMEKLGKADLNCVEQMAKGLGTEAGHALDPLFPTYCFEMNRPMLRLAGSFGQGVYEIMQIASLDGRYLPEDATLFDDGRKQMTVHLLSGETTERWPESMFDPPAGAIQVEELPSHRVLLQGKVIAGRRIGGNNPIYPLDAKLNHEEGKVVLHAIISSDGRIRSLIAVSAPSRLLASSALAAVKTWQYKPYLVGGHPVSVETEIHVIYQLGN
jgi:TonB family protein